MKLKKLISVMLIGACVCSMAACGSKKEEKKIESADDLKDANAVQALVKGKLDAVVIDNEPAKAFVDANDGLKILETPYVEEDYAMCFKKGNTELEDKFNAAIKELKEDGTFDKIVGYYIDGTEEKGYESVMATNAAFEPYEYYEDNKIVGVDVDFAQAIADKLGMELTVNDMEFDSIIAAVDSGKADFGAAGMTVTKGREKQVDFSDSYYTGKQMIIVKK